MHWLRLAVFVKNEDCLNFFIDILRCFYEAVFLKENDSCLFPICFNHLVFELFIFIRVVCLNIDNGDLEILQQVNVFIFYFYDFILVENSNATTPVAFAVKFVVVHNVVEVLVKDYLLIFHWVELSQEMVDSMNII